MTNEKYRTWYIDNYIGGKALKKIKFLSNFETTVSWSDLALRDLLCTHSHYTDYTVTRTCEPIIYC